MLPWRDLGLALLVLLVWGSNFVVITVGLAALPPLLFATLRFLLVAFPAILFLRRPDVPWGNLAAYGVMTGACQFGLLYIAMRGLIAPGMASLVIQTQVIFTVGLSVWLAGERLRPFQAVAALVALSGILLIAGHADGSVTPLGLVLVTGAAIGWASGNLLVRRAGRVNMLAYVVWASLFSVPPLLLLSLLVDGWPAIRHGLAQAGAPAWAALAWQSVANTMFGYAAWGWLLVRHPAARVSPLSLLVPVVGMATAAWWLHEPLPAWKLGAAALVLAGLAINFFWPPLSRQLSRSGSGTW